MKRKVHFFPSASIENFGFRRPLNRWLLSSGPEQQSWKNSFVGESLNPLHSLSSGLMAAAIVRASQRNRKERPLPGYLFICRQRFSLPGGWLGSPRPINPSSGLSYGSITGKLAISSELPDGRMFDQRLRRNYRHATSLCSQTHLFLPSFCPLFPPRSIISCSARFSPRSDVRWRIIEPNPPSPVFQFLCMCA